MDFWTITLSFWLKKVTNASNAKTFVLIDILVVLQITMKCDLLKYIENSKFAIHGITSVSNLNDHRALDSGGMESPTGLCLEQFF